MKKKIDFLLINPPYHKRSNSGTVFPLGLGYLASSVRAAGFNVYILDCASFFFSLHKKSIQIFKNWFIKELKRLKPELAVGVGPCTTPAIKSIKTIAEVCKETFPNLPIIYGGPLSSIEGQKSLFFNFLYATAIVAGDGEIVICDILEALKRDQPLYSVKGVTTNYSEHKINVIKNINNLIFPDRNLDMGFKNYKLSTRRSFHSNTFATMSISRGCPYSCSFCVSGSLRNNLYHRRSITNIIAEIKFLVNKHLISSIVFYDDSFFPAPETLKKDVILFTQALEKDSIQIDWQIEMRPNVLLALDPVLLKYLYKTGCRQINIGFETAESKNSIIPESVARKLHIPELSFCNFNK